MNPQEKENLYEVILAETDTGNYVWGMYADAVVDYIDNHIVEVITGQLGYRVVLAAALAAFNDDRYRFNPNWFDRGSLWVAS